MSIIRRSQARKNEMTSDSADYSRKLDDILAKMDVLITAKTEMLSKLNKLEKAQSTIMKDVEDLKKSAQETELVIKSLIPSCCWRRTRRRLRLWRRRSTTWKTAPKEITWSSGAFQKAVKTIFPRWRNSSRANTFKATWILSRELKWWGRTEPELNEILLKTTHQSQDRSTSTSSVTPTKYFFLNWRQANIKKYKI